MESVFFFEDNKLPDAFAGAGGAGAVQSKITNDAAAKSLAHFGASLRCVQLCSFSGSLGYV